MLDDDGRSGNAPFRALWNDLAAHDALWAVLASEDKRGRRWDIQDFMQAGEREIALALLRCRQLGCEPAFGRAMDFGCGVGRLSQALGRRFDQVVGVDISDRMIALADSLNGYPGRVEYVLLDDNGLLASIGDRRFDFIYSVIVLQHVPSPLARDYIAAFGRALAPGGVVVFQVPDRRINPSTAEIRPMADLAYRAAITFLAEPPGIMSAGAKVLLPLVVTNASDFDWVQPDVGSLRVGNHWFNDTGSLMTRQDDGRSVMPQIVAAHSSFTVDLEVTAPTEPGRHVLELDLVHEGVSWFAGRGSRVVRQQVTVTGEHAPQQNSNQLDERPIPSYAWTGQTETLLDTPPDFPMHGVPKEVVLDVLNREGVEICGIEDDPRAGHDWVSYRYFARKR